MPIGERIKAARKRAGLSLQGLSERVGVTKQAISKYENGLCTPGSEVLRALARTLGVTIDFLTRPTTVEIGEVQFRKLAKLGAKTRHMLEGFAQDALERQLALERIVYGDHCPAFAGHRSIPVSAVQEAEQAAEECRRGLGLGTDPIANLTATLEAWCVRIARAPVSPGGFDGLSAWVTPEVPFIMEPSDEHIPGDRQRFTLAHELGHLVMLCRPGTDEEAAANRFAGAFLVPREALVRELGEQRRRVSWSELRDLRQTYGVSMGTLLFRARDCGIITDTEARRMQEERGKRGWKLREPDPQLAREQPRCMSRLVAHALAEELIGLSRAAELCGKTTAELLDGRL